MAAEPKLVSGETGVGTLLRAALPAIPVVKSLPGIAKRGVYGGLSVRREPVTPTRESVAAYAEVCHFPAKDTLPLPFPHMLAFPLQMGMMADQAFPVPAMGMVHIENSITQHRAIAIGEELTVTAAVGLGVPHPVGTAYAFTTEVRVGDELVWEEVSTYLRRGRRDPDATWSQDLADVAPSGPVWPLASDLGRRYAKVSGDYNPIHLTSLSAKALGQPRHMAHGMWTMARCVAQLENRLPGHVRVDVAFKKPVLLPTSVAFGASRTESGYDFSLHRRGSDTVHLLGRAVSL